MKKKPQPRRSAPSFTAADAQELMDKLENYKNGRIAFSPPIRSDKITRRLVNAKPNISGVVRVKFVGGVLDGQSFPARPPLPIASRLLIKDQSGLAVAYIIRTLPKNGVQLADFEPETIGKPKRKLKTEVEYFSVINRRMQKQEDVWSDVPSLLKYLEVVLHEAKSVKIVEA